MAVVGPLASFALAVIFWGVLQVVPGQDSPLVAVLTYLWLINALLGAFNLLPGFPLDGGRVLRSILWGATGNLSQATNIAATVGQVLAWMLIGFGMFQLFLGNFLGGLWIAFIGWFLNGAAGASRRDARLRHQLSGVPVKEVMDPSPETISPHTSVKDLVHDIFMQRRRRAMPVGQEDRLLGIVTLADVKELSPQKWAETPVSEIMTRQPLYSVAIEDDLNSALRLLAQHDLNQILVLNDGRLVGLLNRADIIRYLQLSQGLTRSSP